MEEQEWRKHARRHAPPRAHAAASGAVSPRVGSSNTRLSNATVASANKAVQRKNEPRANAPSAPPSSRWKELRQGVRIKATLDTEERAPDARIADLCETDREKVAKLVRRIVDVTALHEQSESEFARQRALLETEVHELRGHAKRDARELEQLGEQLKDALGKLRDYQERVLVLAESNELEVRHRLETDKTVDLLKLEVDKLRKLVKRQKSEMERQESERARAHKEEMDEMSRQVREAHELLLRERRERLEEKQKALEERLQRSTEAVEATPNKYDAPGAAPSNNNAVVERVTLPSLDMSLLNTSADLPDKIKDIMNEWKQRMEDALNTTAASIAENGPTLTPQAPRLVSTSVQTDVETVKGSTWQAQVSPRERHRATRPDFDSMLVQQDTSGASVRALRIERSPSPKSRSSTHSPRATRRPGRSTPPPPQPAPSTSDDRSVARALLEEFANASVLVDDESFEDEVESTIALIDGLRSPPSPSPDHTPESRSVRRGVVPPRKLSLFDSSMLDVVDAMENGESNHSHERYKYLEEESPTTRVERLMEGLRVREQKLARASARRPASEGPSFLRDVELFNQVKDVYEADRRHHQGRPRANDEERDEYDADHDDHEDYDSEPVSDSGGHSPRPVLSVQDAIEQDLQELLRQESLHRHTHR